MSNFWKQLPRPIFALAPMADVTDAAFRGVIAKYGAPSVMFTEFVSADGLQSPGRARLLHNLQYNEIERPIVAQIFGAHPENFFQTAKLLIELGFDGIDINMGCPEKNIQKQGSCAALIKEPLRAQEIIQATKDGVQASGATIPVSVKTRIGYTSTEEIETWLPALLAAKPDAITLHLRTKKEMSKVPAHWELAKRAVEIRNNIKSETLLLGNGDVANLDDAREKVKRSGIDGVMLGRAIFGNPWLFAEHAPTVEEKLAVMIEHTKQYEKYFSGIKNFSIMKKHFHAYVAGFHGAKELRTELMNVQTASEVEAAVKRWHSSFQ